MQIYTSYFGNLKNLEKHNIIAIGVCQFPPHWFKNPNLISIAPTKDILFNCKSNHQEFIKRYKSEIISIQGDPQEFINRLNFISEGRDVALCCFEKPNEFCHRHLIAEWLNNSLHLNVQEFQDIEEPKITPLF
jgi:uncharacterized protein (DUF488 family)